MPFRPQRMVVQGIIGNSPRQRVNRLFPLVRPAGVGRCDLRRSRKLFGGTDPPPVHAKRSLDPSPPRIFCSGALAQGSVLLGSGRGVLEKPGFERERALRVRFAEVAETIVEGGLYLRGPPVAKGVKFDLIRRGGRTGLRSL